MRTLPGETRGARWRPPRLVVLAGVPLALVAILLAGLAWRSVGPGAGPTSVKGASGAAGQASVGGYLAPWDEARGLRSLATAGEVLTEVVPVWYTPTDTGAVVPSSSAQEAGSTQGPTATEARAQGVRILPAISNFRDGRWDGELISAIVNDPGRRQAHVAAIRQLVVDSGWDGIDLDYESLRAADRGPYADFVRELGQHLRAAGKQLTVAVPAKTTEPGTDGFQQAHDYRALGEAADAVVVMAYDHSWSTSAAGPIAPAPWVEEVMRFTVSQIPPEKVRLGVAAHGYDWLGRQGTDLMWADAVALAEQHRATVQWDEGTHSPWFSYRDAAGRERTVWFENARSLAAKVEIAERSGVRAVRLWKLGGEDPEVWRVLSHE
jgi:spore germination protein YaaH